MRPLSPREKTLLVAGATAAIILVYLFALLLPARREAAAIALEQTELQGQLAQAKRMYDEAASARELIAELKKQKQELMFSGGDVQADTVQEVEKLAKELGVTVISIRPGDSKAADGAARYPVVIKIEADLGKIARTLYELEQPSHRLWVEGVEITSARQTGPTLSATIYAAAYAPSRESEAGNAEA